MIQKRDPYHRTMKNSDLLSHGTDTSRFLIDRNDPQKGSQNIPNEPAWFAINKKSEDTEVGTRRRYDFNIHAALMKMKVNGTLPTELYKTAIIHIYEYNPNPILRLAAWKEWPHAAEYIFRQQAQADFSLYYKLIQTLATDLTELAGYFAQAQEVYRSLTIDEREENVMEYYRRNNYNFTKNRTEPAIALKNYISDDGYLNETDVVRNEPEVVLFQKGLQKLFLQTNSICRMMLTGIDTTRRNTIYTFTGYFKEHLYERPINVKNTVDPIHDA